MELRKPLNSSAGTAPLTLAFLMMIASSPGLAATSDLCVQAARDASEETGVPYKVLLAITVVETGQLHNGKNKPWPWAVNAGGEGHWFDNLTEAELHVQGLLDQGSTNIDLGCFQLNYRWHRQHFASISEMLDPARNAEYAARYLVSLRKRTGDWGSAAAAYHSGTPQYADRYRTRFDEAYAALDGEEIFTADERTDDGANGFPLLIAGRSGQFGSLVPSSDRAAALFGSP